MNFWKPNLALPSVSRDRCLVKAIRGVRKLERFSDSELRRAAQAIRQASSAEKPKRGWATNSVPVVVEAIRRTLGFTLHGVQIQAAMATATGQIIEMSTGEGKTAVTGAAALLQALMGRVTHVATTNYYLAERDYNTLQPAFDLLGFTSGLLPMEMIRSASRQAYDCDITYGPGYQFGFDFLFDQITLRQHDPAQLGRSIVEELSGFDLNQQLVQCRSLDACIIDEVDSVLVDEATTPLILSFESDKDFSPLPYELAKSLSRTLVLDQHFKLDTQQKSIDFTDAGELAIREFRGARKLRLERPWQEYVKSALFAENFLLRDEDYVVQRGEVNIVDQYTGRIFDDRSWQAGLHQAVEAKEGLTINSPRVSKAKISRQRFMKFYKSISGLSGTAVGARRDFKEFYDAKVISVPTHLPCQRKLTPPRFFVNHAAKYSAIVSDAKRRQQRGQPVLIGTATIRESLDIQSVFESSDVKTVVLNGIQDREEAEIVAGAGQAGVITIATNMAGRGTDIKLSEEAKRCGGLHVIGASPNQSGRIDRQLVGRAARQGQPGSAQFFVSARDELVEEFAPKLGKRIRRRGNRNGEAALQGSLEIASTQMKRENLQFCRRKEMVMKDCWMDSVRSCLFGENTDG